MDVSLKLIPDSESVWPDFYLLNSGSTLIGRAPNCSLYLDSPTISRWHCIVDVAPNAVFVTDLHSINGTYVNDRRAIRQPLGNADVLRLGDISFIVSINSSPDFAAFVDDFALSVLPDSSSEPKAQPTPPAASALAALLPSPVRQGPAAAYLPQPPRQQSYPVSQLTRQMARYERALTDCTAQLRLLTEKVAALQSRINTLNLSAGNSPPQHSPKKAFEPHDALMYIARAAVREKARQQSVAASLPDQP